MVLIYVLRIFCVWSIPIYYIGNSFWLKSLAGCELARILKWHTHILTSITLVMLKYCLHGMQYLFVNMLFCMFEFFAIGTISHSQFSVSLGFIMYILVKQSKRYFCPIKCCTKTNILSRKFWIMSTYKSQFLQHYIYHVVDVVVCYHVRMYKLIHVAFYKKKISILKRNIIAFWPILTVLKAILLTFSLFWQ